MEKANCTYNKNNRLEVYLNNVREKALTKDKEWIENFIQKDRIGFDFSDKGRLDTKIRKNRYVDIIHSIMDGLEELYPEDWDIFISLEKNLYNGYFFTLTPVILFREIDITNSKSIEHHIKNLFVFIPIEKNLKIGIIKGTRSSISKKEFEAGYLHSHLPSQRLSVNYKRPFDLGDFCLGQSEMLYLKTEMLSNRKFDMDLFRLYIMCLKTYVSWESLEGIPYNKIEEIKSNSNVTIHYSDFNNNFQNYFSEYYGWIKNEIYRDFQNFEVIRQEENFNVKIDESFKNHVTDYLLKKGLCGVLGHRDGINWRYKKSSHTYEFEPRHFEDGNGQASYIIFSGEKMYMEIYDKEEDEKIDIRYPHPNFLSYLKERIKEYIYEKQLRSYTIERLFESYNAR